MAAIDRATLAKVIGFMALIIGSLFVGAWAGPLGVVLFVLLSSIYLYFNGLTWNNLWFCCVFSFVLALLACWLQRHGKELFWPEKRKPRKIRVCPSCRRPV